MRGAAIRVIASSSSSVKRDVGSVMAIKPKPRQHCGRYATALGMVKTAPSTTLYKIDVTSYRARKYTFLITIKQRISDSLTACL
jgi:hypothetical protein